MWGSNGRSRPPSACSPNATGPRPGSRSWTAGSPGVDRMLRRPGSPATLASRPSPPLEREVAQLLLPVVCEKPAADDPLAGVGRLVVGVDPPECVRVPLAGDLEPVRDPLRLQTAGH